MKLQLCLCVLNVCASYIMCGLCELTTAPAGMLALGLGRDEGECVHVGAGLFDNYKWNMILKSPSLN